jgi:hypothetical protein
VNGVEIEPGTSSADIPLSSPTTDVSVLVTAESGHKTTYSFTVLTVSDINAVFTSESSIPVVFPSYNATGLAANFTLGFLPTTGTNLTVINNTGIDFITGRFTNLAQGQVVALSYQGVGYEFVANYYAGNGNDLVLEWARRTAVAWGTNYNWQLGNGGGGSTNVPVMVSNTGILHGKIVSAVAGGDSHGLALCSDGTMAAWGGANLGSATTSISSVPIPVSQNGVLSSKTVVAVSAANLNSLALCADGMVASPILAVPRLW